MRLRGVWCTNIAGWCVDAKFQSSDEDRGAIQLAAAIARDCGPRCRCYFLPFAGVLRNPRPPRPPRVRLRPFIRKYKHTPLTRNGTS